MSQIFLLCLVLGIIGTTSSESQFTVNIDPADEKCFYAPASVGDQLFIQYHVVQRGNEAESRISFYVTDASAKIIASDLEAKQNSYTFTADVDGDFKACFGNFITYTKKQVFFTTSVGNPNSTEWNQQDVVFEGTDALDDFDFKLFDIEHLIDQIRLRLLQARTQQRQLRLLETRDRSLAETNFELVNQWSLVQMLVMVAVLVVQVLMVRNLFCDPLQKPGRLWRWKRGGSVR